MNVGSADPLNLNFPRYVTKIDAALVWPRNGRTYFFSGEQYWRYNSKKRVFDKGYPKNIASAWRGLPSRIDSAFSPETTDTSIFIAGGTSYVFDDR